MPQPGDPFYLWIVYQENGVPITGLTDLKVEAKYSTGETVLSETVLQEKGGGEYYYNWDTAEVELDKNVLIYYKKGSTVLNVESYYFSLSENDEDGTII